MRTNTDGQKQFGQWLRAKRDALNMARETAAETIGIGAQTLYNFEVKGQAIPIETAVLLGDAYGIERDELHRVWLAHYGGDPTVVREPGIRYEIDPEFNLLWDLYSGSDPADRKRAVRHIQMLRDIGREESIGGRVQDDEEAPTDGAD